MFVYSLAGLELEGGDNTPIEIEENETTARSAVYQVFGRFFGSADRDHFDRARDGLWRKELAEASSLLPFPLALPAGELPESFTPESYVAEAQRVLDPQRLLGRNYGSDAHDEITRAYEYYGLTIREDGPPPDHITIGCDYMQYLTFKDAAASSDRLRGSYRRAQSDFLAQHLLAWTNGLAEVVADSSPLDFFGESTASLAAFIEADAAYLGSE